MAKNRALDPRRVVGTVLSKLNENKGNLVGGNFSQFGGTNGARHDMWGDAPSRTGKLGTAQPADGPMPRHANKSEANTKVNKAHRWDDGADVFGRTGAMKKTEKYTTGPETNDQAAERGARMKVSPDVTILGSKLENHNRTPVGAVNRAAGKDIIAENSKLGLNK